MTKDRTPKSNSHLSGDIRGNFSTLYKNKGINCHCVPDFKINLKTKGALNNTKTLRVAQLSQTARLVVWVCWKQLANMVNFRLKMNVAYSISVIEACISF